MHFFFVASDFAAERAIASGVSPRKLRRLYNPIDLQKFAPCTDARRDIRRELRIPDDAFVVGFVGRHCTSKGTDLLGEALTNIMSEHRAVYALWVGDGPALETTTRLLQQRTGLHRHRMLSWTAAPERYYAAMDCLVAPSRIEETFGRVVVEAQACAVPVVAIASAGMAEAFLPGISGIPLNRPCAESIEQAIMLVHDDPSLREELITQGLAFATRFDMNEIAHGFARTLESL